MCRVPDKDDPKYKDDDEAYEDDLEEMQEKTWPGSRRPCGCRAGSPSRSCHP